MAEGEKKASKLELTSDNGNVHVTVENPEELEAAGIDVLEEAKALMEYHEAVDRRMRVEELRGINEELVYLGDKPEQYADAIIGVTYDGNHIIYSTEKFEECLVKEGMTPEEAEDWTSYNTARAIPYMGEFAPILMNEIDR